MSATKKRITKSLRNSPRVPADFDSESEDQNGSHIYPKTSVRIPTSSSSIFKTPNLRDTSQLWGLDTPSGTDSGICSSDRAVPWSSEQRPSKTKSTLFVAPSVEPRTSLLSSSIPFTDAQWWKLCVFFNILSFVTSFILMFIFSYYFFIKMYQFKTSLTNLSHEIQTSKINPIADSSIYDDGLIPSIQQDITTLKESSEILLRHHEKFSQNLSEVKSSLNSLKGDDIINIKDSITSLQNRFINIETIAESHTSYFVQFENYLLQCNNSMFELDERLTNLQLQMEQINVSSSSFGNPEGINLNLIELAFARHYQDQIGMYDFALGSAGGRIVDELTSQTYSGSEAIRVFGFTIFSLSNSPEVVLQPSVLPGNCWPFSGSDGKLGISITHDIFLQNITIDHVPNELTDDGTLISAPKDFLIRGLKSLGSNGIELGHFSYRRDSMFPFQIFLIPKSLQNAKFSIFQLEFKSNHGHPNFTCIYRVRLHGSISLV